VNPAIFAFAVAAPYAGWDSPISKNCPWSATAMFRNLEGLVALYDVSAALYGSIRARHQGRFSESLSQWALHIESA
jgi:hypothetical protein